MANAKAPNQTMYWQIYAMTDLAITEKQVKQAVESGYKGFALTVDAIRPGKRDRDLRASYCEADEKLEEEEDLVKEPSVKRP